MNTRTRRPALVLAAAATAAALALAGCTAGGGDSDADSITILTAASPGTPGGDLFQSVIDDFTEESGITVNVEFGGEEVPLVFETSVAANKQADLVNINPVANPLSWIDNGIVVPVDQYLDEWGLTDRLLPAALAEWTRDSDGQVQGFPFEGYQWPVWFNTALFDQAGVDIPTTTDELIDAAAALRAAGIQPFAIGGNDWSGQKLLLQIAQSYLTPDEAKEVFTNGGWCSTPAALKGLELFVELRDAGVFIDDAGGLEASSMSAAFYTGQAAMMSAGSWEMANVEEPLAPNVLFGGFPVPADGEYDMPTAYQGTANGYWISTKGVEKIDLIRQFIEYLYSPEVAARYVNEAQVITALETDPALLDSDINPLLAQITSELPATVEYAVHPDKYIPGTLTEQFIRQTALAFQPGTTADAACAALDSVYGG
ncbi:ABC transporter substrate-binding protein [Schumannella luteola]